MVLPQSKIFVNFVNFKVFSILLILVFDLKSCFYVCFNLFEWSQVEENAKKFKGRNRSEIGPKTECKQSKNRGLRDFATSAKLALRYEAISQPKRSRCGIDVSLRKRPSFTKSFRSFIFSSAKIFEVAKPSLAHVCHFATQESPFRSCEGEIGTWVPLRSIGASISQLRNVCEAVKPRFRNKSPIPQGISQLRKRFWHTCATSQHSDTQFAAAKRIAKWLRKWIFAAKLAFFCETQNDP